jgi:hypothetical protein
MWLTIDKAIMIEELKTLEVDDTIIFSDEQVIDFFEDEEMTVTGIRVYKVDDNEMIVVEMDEFYLIVHNFQSEETCYVYQLVDEGDTGDLEDDGYKFLNEEDDFRHKIVIREEGKTQVYHHSDTGAIYDLTRERDDEGSDEPVEVSLCEFISHSGRLTHILIEREDERALIMQGFEIDEDALELPE